jgi:hypothetical protein
LPSIRSAPEQRPRDIPQFFRITVTTAKKIHQRIVRELVDVPLQSIGRNLILLTTVTNDKTVSNFQETGRRDQSGADVPEGIEVVTRGYLGRESNPMFRQKVGFARWVHAQHEHERHFLKAIERNIVTSLYPHDRPPALSASISVELAG